jgi:hypothetical protein
MSTVWAEYGLASRRKNKKRLRHLQLMCDAIAAQTLLRIGVPPAMFFTLP